MGNFAANDQRFWLRVFNNSKANGAPYLGDHLPAYSWAWPTDTYLQRRLRILRADDDAQPTVGTFGGIESRQDDRMLRPAPVLDPALERYTKINSDVVMLSAMPSSSRAWDDVAG